jgi:hypothetical protein
LNRENYVDSRLLSTFRHRNGVLAGFCQDSTILLRDHRDEENQYHVIPLSTLNWLFDFVPLQGVEGVDHNSEVRKKENDGRSQVTERKKRM